VFHLRFADSSRPFNSYVFYSPPAHSFHWQQEERPAMSENPEGPWLFEFEDGQSIRFAVHEAVEDRDECIELIEVGAAFV
jgi:hypothetical protein